MRTGSRWQIGLGYKHRDNDLASDAVQKVIDKGGETWKSKAAVKGKGGKLPGGDSPARVATRTVEVRDGSSPKRTAPGKPPDR